MRLRLVRILKATVWGVTLGIVLSTDDRHRMPVQRGRSRGSAARVVSQMSGDYRIRLAVCGVVGAALGWLMWELSPTLIGKVEPWDAQARFWPTALTAGAIVGAIASRHWWVGAIAVFVGQMAFIELRVHAENPILPSVIGVPFSSGAPVLIGAIAASLVVQRIPHRRSSDGTG